MTEEEMADTLLAKSLVSIQDLSGGLNQLPLNDGGVVSVTAVDRRPVAPSSKGDIKTAALGSTALKSVALRKSLINQPLARCLLDHLLGRSFGRQ